MTHRFALLDLSGLCLPGLLLTLTLLEKSLRHEDVVLGRNASALKTRLDAALM